jgi:hypothetical protein
LPALDVTGLTLSSLRPAEFCAEMVTWRTPRCLPILLLAWLSLPGALGCTSIDGPASDVDEWKGEWRQRAVRLRDGASAGATAVGDSIGTAYRGVRGGFEDPQERGFGPYPKGFADAIRRHMLRFEGVGNQASFQFGKPERAYMNRGILAGGEIEWQGWAVDVSVETKSFAGQSRSKAYVVRMTDGEVEEVQDAGYAGAIRRLTPSEPASAAK